MSALDFEFEYTWKRIPLKAINCMVAHKGSLWVGSSPGLWKISLSNFKTSRVATDFITDVHVSDDAVWCSTWMDRGLIKVSRDGLRILGSPPVTEGLLPRDVRRQHCVSAEKQVAWVGADAGLYRYEIGKGWSQPLVDSPVTSLKAHRANLWCTVRHEEKDTLVQVRNGIIQQSVNIAISPSSSAQVHEDELWCAGTDRSGFPLLMRRSLLADNAQSRYYTLSRTAKIENGFVVCCTSVAIQPDYVICGMGTFETGAMRLPRVKGGGLLIIDRNDYKVRRLPVLNGENVAAMTDYPGGLCVATSKEIIIFRRQK